MRSRMLPLGEICRIVTGGTPPRTKPAFFGGGIPWVKIGDLVQGLITRTEETLSPEGVEKSGAKLLPAGTVLISIFATIGRTACLDIAATTNQAIAGVIPHDPSELDSSYLRYFLDSQKGVLQRAARGVAQPNINQRILRTLDVPVPPLADQRRIVDILSRAEGILRLRREAEKKAAELMPAIFLEMFGDPATNPKGWPTATLGELIVDGPQNGLYKHKSAYGSGVPILRIDAFYAGAVTNTQLKRVRLDSTEVSRYRLSEGDIVINRVNSPEFVGKSAMIPALSEPTVFESNMMRLRVDPRRMLPHFLIALLQTDAARRHLAAQAKHAINQSSINQQDVKTLPIHAPPLRLQEVFAQRVHAVKSIVDQQVVATEAAATTLGALLANNFVRGRT